MSSVAGKTYCDIVGVHYAASKAALIGFTKHLAGELGPYGITINFYDPKRQCWTAVWIYPEQGQTTVMTGGEINGRYVLTGHDEMGALQRWSTGVEGTDSVVGRFDISEDNGKTWRAVGVNHMRRHSG